jgi:large subunit ribosomal protein L18
MKATVKTLRKKNEKSALRLRRKARVRKTISGSAQRPRLSVFRSAKHIYVQAIDDVAGVTLAQASTVEKETAQKAKEGKKSEAATLIGTLLGQRLMALGVKEAVFDRNGFRFGGRVKALADGAREAGVKF